MNEVAAKIYDSFEQRYFKFNDNLLYGFLDFFAFQLKSKEMV